MILNRTSRCPRFERLHAGRLEGPDLHGALASAHLELVHEHEVVDVPLEPLPGRIGEEQKVRLYGALAAVQVRSARYWRFVGRVGKPQSRTRTLSASRITPRATEAIAKTVSGASIPKPDGISAVAQLGLSATRAPFRGRPRARRPASRSHVRSGSGNGTARRRRLPAPARRRRRSSSG